MELITLNDVAELLQVSRREATRICNLPGCPCLPRAKGGRFWVPKAAFIEWWEEGGFNEEIQI